MDEVSDTATEPEDDKGVPDIDPSQMKGMVRVAAEPDSNSSTSLLFGPCHTFERKLRSRFGKFVHKIYSFIDRHSKTDIIGNFIPP